MNTIFLGDSKKSSLLRAALELFAEKDYDVVSVRDIAKKAGVSEAALYKHFKGKEDMALYIFNAIMIKYVEKLLEIKNKQIEAIDKLCDIVGVTYDLYQKYPDQISFVLLSQYKFWNMLNDESKPHFIIKSILEEGMEHGEIPQQEVYLWLSIYSGIIFQPLSQYKYFYDVLPDFLVLKEKVSMLVRKVFR